jgi:hypothetical protein
MYALVHRRPRHPSRMTVIPFLLFVAFQWRIHGGREDTSPTGLKRGSLQRSLYVKTANFFGALRRLLFN